MITKKGFIVKSVLKQTCKTIFNHLKPGELYLIGKICKDAQDEKVEVMETTYTNEDMFITQRF